MDGKSRHASFRLKASVHARESHSYYAVLVRGGQGSGAALELPVIFNARKKIVAGQLRQTNCQALQILGAEVDSIVKLQIHRSYHGDVGKVRFSAQLIQLDLIPFRDIIFVDVAANLDVVEGEVGLVEIR